MRSDALRRAIAEGLIVVAVLAAASTALVQPIRARATHAQAMYLQMRADIDEADTFAPGGVAESDGHVGARAAWLREKSEEGADGRALYETIMRLGAETGVQIDRLQPASIEGESAPGGDRRSGFVVSAFGDYGAVTKFVLALEQRTGLSCATSVRVAPVSIEERQLAHATIETLHLAVALDEAPSALGGAE